MATAKAAASVRAVSAQVSSCSRQPGQRQIGGHSGARPMRGNRRNQVFDGLFVLVLRDDLTRPLDQHVKNALDNTIALMNGPYPSARQIGVPPDRFSLIELPTRSSVNLQVETEIGWQAKL
jgi:hypothetical protein